MTGMKGKEMVSRLPFAETVDRLRKAVEENGLKVVSAIDAQQNLKKIGIQSGGNQILEFFNPRLAAEVFKTDIRAGIVPPIRIYIYEDNVSTHVAAQNASTLFSEYNGLEDLGKRIDEMLLSILKVIE
ncbi:MAG: DUF302 domain-containing protein [Candidatus Thermoplasmatota archaeon]|nr:DUF302 domain-containing protein [Candidatus Thermoplasmatota archaeon]